MRWYAHLKNNSVSIFNSVLLKILNYIINPSEMR